MVMILILESTSHLEILLVLLTHTKLQKQSVTEEMDMLIGMRRVTFSEIWGYMNCGQTG